MATAAGIENNVLLERARALAPLIEQHRDEGERERQLPQPIYEAMRDAGLYNMLLPRALGGYQTEIVPSLLVYEEIARQDGAVGWNIMIGSQGGMFSDYLSESAARSVYGAGDAVCAGSFGPTGRAIPVDGGYRLSGHWAFASGCRHATWFVCGALIIEGDKPRMRENGAPDIQILYVPAQEGRILDTWYSGGLRGTGSHDIELDDVFVPKDRCFAFASLSAGPIERAGTGYTQPFVSLASVGMAALALGIARDALDSFKRLAMEKTPSSGSVKLMAQPVVQDRYAEAEALVASSRLYFYDAAEKLEAAAHPAPDILTLVRLACAHAVRSCERAIGIVYSLGGGTAVYNTSRLDRCFRDVHTLSHHIAVSPSHFEMAGQYLLGGEMQARR